MIQFEIQEAGHDSHSADGSKSKALDNAVRLVANFFEQGGEVDFVLPEELEGTDGEHDENRGTRDELRVAVMETRELAIGSRSVDSESVSESESNSESGSEQFAVATSFEDSKQTGGLGTRSLPKHNGSE